jgi:predicted enzyme related to lactoylglutathione lyase
VFGVWQQTGMIGASVDEEPGAIIWDDAHLHDVEAGKRFYADVFGFRYAPLGPEAGETGDYETFLVPAAPDRPGGGIGGMMGAPPGTPSHWLAYFTVTDADAAADAVGAGGGRVLMAPESTPFGRIGVVIDPFGAVFGLHSAPAG